MIDFNNEVIGPLMDVFGQAATYIPTPGFSYPITGNFLDAYLKEDMFDDGSSGVTEVSAELGVQLSQFKTIPRQNDQLLMVDSGVLYMVRQVRPDGVGHARLLLSRVL